MKPLYKIFTFAFLIQALWLAVSAQSLDQQLLENIHTKRNKNLDRTFSFFSNTVLPVSFLSPTLQYVNGISQNKVQLKQYALQQSIGLAFCASSSWLIKQTIKRERPYVHNVNINPYNFEASMSFPSAHSSLSFYTATINTLQFKKWYVAVPLYTWAGTVAYSRMHLGVHYPSDVLAGAFWGSASAWLTFQANKYWQQRCNKH